MIAPSSGGACPESASRDALAPAEIWSSRIRACSAGAQLQKIGEARVLISQAQRLAGQAVGAVLDEIRRRRHALPSQ